MKNYEQILSDNGIEIPEESKAAIKKEMLANYKTIAEYTKVVEKRDELETSLTDIQGKLDAFKDVNVNELKGQIATLTSQLDDEKKGRAADAAKAERDKSIDSFMSGKKFVNALTEKSIRQALSEELEKDTSKGKSIEDLFKAVTSDKDGNTLENILVDEAHENKAKFTKKKDGENGGKTMTKAEILAIKDTSERRAAIANNIGLFNGGDDE